MTQEIMNDKVMELLQDESFVAEMKSAETYGDAALVLENHGIDVTAEDLMTGMAEAKKVVEEKGLFQDGELSEESLESVSGGWGPNWRTGVYFGGEVAGCLAILSGVAAGPVGWAVLGGMALCGTLAIGSMLH